MYLVLVHTTPPVLAGVEASTVGLAAVMGAAETAVLVVVRMVGGVVGAVSAELFDM